LGRYDILFRPISLEPDTNRRLRKKIKKISKEALKKILE